MEGEISEEDYCQISPDHIDFAVGKIYKFHNSVDQCIAKGDKGIDTADGYTVNNLLEEHRFYYIAILTVSQ